MSSCDNIKTAVGAGIDNKLHEWGEVLVTLLVFICFLVLTEVFKFSVFCSKKIAEKLKGNPKYAYRGMRPIQRREYGDVTGEEEEELIFNRF